MSQYYDQASLVMIPSGYKDGKVYSQKPLSTSGELTFTRNSNATRVDANGLIEKVRTNSLLQSNSFDTTWINSNSTDTGGQADKDGGTTAWKIDKTAASGYIRQAISQSGVQTFSVYAKAGTLNWVRLIADGGTSTPSTWFDLANGVVGAADFFTIDAKIEAAGNGYYRCSISYEVGTIAGVRIYPADDNNDISGTSGNIYIQDAQLEQGLVATDYIETTTTAMSDFAGVTASSVADVPRLDYSGDCPSLLLEPQRTNSCAFSEFIGSYFFYTNASATNNATTSPEGVLNAASIIPDATSGIHQIASSNITASGSFTLSAFVKAGELNKVAIRESNATGAYASFDLSTGTKIEDNVSGASFIESYANGWYRIGVTYTYSGNIRLGINALSNSYTTGNPSSGATYWSSNGTDKLYVYGLQCELGATYQTSYLPSNGTTVTRLADSCSKTGISSLIGQTAGTLFVEFKNLDNFQAYIGVDNGSVGDRIILYGTLENKVFVQIRKSSSTVFSAGSGVISGGAKAAVAFDASGAVFYVNGTQIGSGSGTTYANNLVQFTMNHANQIGAKVDQALVFKTRLSNADLANLTTL